MFVKSDVFYSPKRTACKKMNSFKMLVCHEIAIKIKLLIISKIRPAKPTNQSARTN